MVDEDIGLCATCQKWLMFIINLVLFILGVSQIGIACYVFASDSDGLGFASELVEGNDTTVNAVLAFGIVLTIISFLGCVGFKKESRSILWLYAIILCLMIFGQAMAIAVVTVSLKYGDSVFGSLWRDLESDTIEDIQVTYKCCSFNGNSQDAWIEDSAMYDECENEHNFDPLETCWGKFEGMIEDNYNMVKASTAVFLGCQIVIYFSTHYVLQSIANAEGREEVCEIERHGRY